MCHIFDKGDSFKEWSTLSSLDHIWLGQSFTATLLHGSSLSTLISKGHFEWASFQVSEPMLVKKKKKKQCFHRSPNNTKCFPPLHRNLCATSCVRRYNKCRKIICRIIISRASDVRGLLWWHSEDSVFKAFSYKVGAS